VVIGEKSTQLESEQGGYFSGYVDNARAGDRYRFRLGDGEVYPDPASRFQPEGPHGPSETVDPSGFRWTDPDWEGIPLERAVIYEMHVGTFTQEGTWASAARQLPALRDTGITVIEVMPVADFSGRWGWGYDGVNLYAPTRLYGRPDDFRAFVDAAHQHGIAVILDVVYNHVGADGNYLGSFAKNYFSSKHTTDWGDAINFDGPGCQAVREYFVQNAGYWVDEFHLDGLRLDATQSIFDDSEPHVLAEITAQVRKAARGRHTIVVAENEPQHTRLVLPPDRGGFGMDALWNDDLHHSAIVALTSHNDAYYTDHKGRAQEFVSAFKYGYLYQGQRYKWQKNRRGTPTFGLPPAAFVCFIENHDQVANTARGDRLGRMTAPGLLRAMTTAILLGPGTPMLFQGQEFGSTKTFQYFADVPEHLSQLVRDGRREFLEQWRSIATPEMIATLPDPCAQETFECCKLDHSERQKNASVYALHTDLLKLRREDPVFSRWHQVRYDGAVLGEHAFLLRAFGGDDGDRLMLFNFGRDLHLDPAPEPLLAPPEESEWAILFSTESPRYDGTGTAPPDSEDNWRLPGWAALVLHPQRRKEQKEK
jgi:maltooligosyltrehalose trehalohydrolase